MLKRWSQGHACESDWLVLDLMRQSLYLSALRLTLAKQPRPSKRAAFLRVPDGRAQFLTAQPAFLDVCRVQNNRRSQATWAPTASPNDATCSRYGRAVPHLLVGALVNAWAVSEAVAELLASTDLSVTVLACGERWKQPNEDGELRFAIEDYLGAGAILSALLASLSRSPEAQICQGAFLAARDDLRSVLWESGSGREVRAMGFPEDVEHAARMDVYDAVPVMQGEMLTALHPPGGGPRRPHRKADRAAVFSRLAAPSKATTRRRKADPQA